MPRSPRPDDLYTLKVPIEVRLSPDGTRIAFVLKETAPGKDGYRLSIWLVPADGSAPAPAPDAGRPARHLAPLESGWHDAGVPERPVRGAQRGWCQ